MKMNRIFYLNRPFEEAIWTGHSSKHVAMLFKEQHLPIGDKRTKFFIGAFSIPFSLVSIYDMTYISCIDIFQSIFLYRCIYVIVEVVCVVTHGYTVDSEWERYAQYPLIHPYSPLFAQYWHGLKFARMCLKLLVASIGYNHMAGRLKCIIVVPTRDTFRQISPDYAIKMFSFLYHVQHERISVNLSLSNFKDMEVV